MKYFNFFLLPKLLCSCQHVAVQKPFITNCDPGKTSLLLTSLNRLETLWSYVTRFAILKLLKFYGSIFSHETKFVWKFHTCAQWGCYWRHGPPILPYPLTFAWCDVVTGCVDNLVTLGPWFWLLVLYLLMPTCPLPPISSVGTAIACVYSIYSRFPATCSSQGQCQQIGIEA